MIPFFLDIVHWLLRFTRHDNASCTPVNFVKYGSGVMFMGSAPHRAWCKRHAAESSDLFVRVFGIISENEGSTSAVNTYDNQKVTLGAGFGAFGQLPKVASTLNIPSVIPLPDKDGKYSNELITTMQGEKYLQSWVCAAESLALREKIFAAQADTFKKTKSRYGFPTDNLPLLYLLCHMSHWYPGCVRVGGWTGRDSTDVPRLLETFKSECAKYKIVPSDKQIDIYLKKYRALGGTYA